MDHAASEVVREVVLACALLFGAPQPAMVCEGRDVTIRVEPVETEASREWRISVDESELWRLYWRRRFGRQPGQSSPP